MLQDKESLVFSNDMISDAQDILITNRIAEDFLQNQYMKKNLDTKSLWVLGVGTIMAGPLIGWNFGVGEVGPLGMFVALIILSFYYCVFFLISAKLSVLYPYIGGPYAYVRQGLGSFGAYWAGVLTCFEFIGGTAVVLAAFRNYLAFINTEYSTLFYLSIFIVLLVNLQLFSSIVMTFVHYCFTCCALGVLAIFLLGTFETVQSANLLIAAPTLFDWRGILNALPFISLFFMGLENITMTAEEVRFPGRSMPNGLFLGFFTAVVISFSIGYFTVGSVNWQLLKASEFPLLFTLVHVQSQDKVLISTFTVMSSVGFIAALQGFINGYSRQVYALSRGGYFPSFLSKLHPRRKTYPFAILVPAAISLGLSYLFSIKLLIVGAFYSAVIVHLLIIISFIRIRNSEPELFYPYRRVYDSFLLYLTVVILTGILFGFAHRYLLENWRIMVLIPSIISLYYFIFGVKNIRQEAPEEAAAASKIRRNRIRFS
ncbi:amino acid permease [Desulfosporosinus fructosivorans]|uniref:Amino acid permease n=1 Tax=Desulfosporosinus fructosivorans TaxID=2018669 RepID=A0A4Z0QZ72_9FIRM|nr:APC family permease [Desulfosporosinus fructosivorans]TGE35047.1 amino acid permease [Desulfosporosinus fructosivorans]